MRTKEIEIEGIEITLHRKKIKNLYLRVLPPNGEVVISAPYALPYEELIRFVKYRKTILTYKNVGNFSPLAFLEGSNKGSDIFRQSWLQK